jgi:hypothetical protein
MLDPSSTRGALYGFSSLFMRLILPQHTRDEPFGQMLALGCICQNGISLEQRTTRESTNTSSLCRKSCRNNSLRWKENVGTTIATCLGHANPTAKDRAIGTLTRRFDPRRCFLNRRPRTKRGPFPCPVADEAIELTLHDTH